MSKDRFSFFGTEVDRRSLDEIMGKGQRTAIQELEMLEMMAALAVLAAVKVWQKLIKSFCSLIARQCEVPFSRVGQQMKTVTK